MTHRRSQADADPRTVASPLILVICQVYPPDPASVGQHIADVAEEMTARGYRVVVMTSARGYEDPQQRYARFERRRGVEVVRLPLSSFGKQSLPLRLLGQFLFLIQATIRGLFARRVAGILVSTSPPMAALSALPIGFLCRVPITYWLMDLNPDQVLALGQASRRNPLVVGMAWLNRSILRRAAAVVTLDRFMAARIKRQYGVARPIEILPPWPHCEASDVILPTDNPFRQRHNPAGRFVVMYSGNHSPASPVTTLLQVAFRLRHDPRFLFLFVGGGSGKREVEAFISAERATNVVSLPYQPLDQIKYSLSAADLHVVTIGDDMPGIIHPCKIYGAMAAGRPALLIGPRRSHAGELIDQHQIGWQVDHGDVTAAIDVLDHVASLPTADRANIGARARAAVQSHYSKQRLCKALCDVVERSLLAPSRTASAKTRPARQAAPALSSSKHTHSPRTVDRSSRRADGVRW